MIVCILFGGALKCTLQNVMASGAIYCTTKPNGFGMFKTNFMIVCILFGGALKCTLQIVMA